jgi:hypothetical protein
MRGHFLPMLLAIVSAGPLSGADPDGVAFFEKKVRPIFVEHCNRCHGAKAEKAKGNLRLDIKAGWTQGGDSGPAVIGDDPERSPLIRAVRRDHKTIEAMPPDKPLSKEQIADLEAWVKRGAPAPDDGASVAKGIIDIAAAKARWPFTPIPARVPVPTVRDAAWPRTEIDRFILAKLEDKGLKPVGDADRRTLIRRVTFDLIGLPPTPEEINAFLADESKDAFANVVNRLLASPHYGERWGRHWLDVARYADTAGDNSDYPIPQMFRYRDWVIEAFNRDLPYDQFIREQLAGDLLGGEDDTERRRRIIATGYIANARRFGSRVDDYPQHLTIEDTIDNLGRAFLGLTLNCARCHDHKFDPVTMRDYYALYGIFASTRYPWPGIELEKRQRDLVPLVDPEEVVRVHAVRKKEVEAIDLSLKYLRIGMGFSFSQDRKNEYLKKIDAKKKEKERLLQRPLPFPQAYAVADGTKIADSVIQLKGNPEQPGESVHRRFLEVLGGQTLPDGETTSGRRRLADWIASPTNPLTARVMMNRIWHGHFHRGLVATPNDFGKQGSPPTHPELLDYLARRFIVSGWSIKSMHREILLSRTYQLASSGEVPGAETKDANNELLAKFRRTRLDAESIRDSLLAVSDRLDRTPGGPHPFPEQTKWDFTQHKPFRAVYDHDKRSVYLMSQRIQRHPFLAIFDGPDTGASTARRTTSTTALQSLFLLNDPFVHARAKDFAERIRTARSADDDRIGWAYRTAIGRNPTAKEIEHSRVFLRKAFEAGESPYEAFARALFRLNEFVYIE